MVKIYRGGEEQVEVPETGWGYLWFPDGYAAQVSGATILKIEGVEYVKFYLFPFPQTRKRFGIDVKKDLDKNMHCYRIFPKEFVYPLNLYDPARRVFFSLVNWDGKETEATNWFNGKLQSEELIRWKRRVRELQAQIEALKEENFILRTNAKRFYAENFNTMIKPMMPAIRSLLIGEREEEKR